MLEWHVDQACNGRDCLLVATGLAGRLRNKSPQIVSQVDIRQVPGMCVEVLSCAGRQVVAT